MAAALLTQGLTALRDAIRNVAGNFWTHVGIATDQTAFSAGQTALDPANAGASDFLIKSATFAVVDAQTIDGTIAIDGTSEFTNKTIFTIGICKGSARTDALSRSVRSQGIGVQAGDSFTIGVRLKVEDNS